MYSFVWSAEELAKFECIFIKPYPDSYFTTNLIYRRSKLTPADIEAKYPLTNIVRPTLFKASELSLQRHIEREYTRKLGSFDPIEYSGDALPSRVFAVYLNNTPVNIKKAEKDLTKILVNDILDYGEVQGSVYSKLNHCCNLQNNPYIHLENDDKNWKSLGLNPVEYVQKYLKDFGVQTFWILETRGGYHYIIPKSECKRLPRLFIEILQKLIDDGVCTHVKSHGIMPIAGTVQYGFPVKLVYPNEEKSGTNV